MSLIEEDPITMRPKEDGSTSGSIGTQEALTGTILRQQQAAAVRRIEQQAEQRAEYVEKRKLRGWIKKSQRPKGKVAAPSQKATEISAISMEKKTGRPRGQNLLENVSRVEQKKLQEWAESEQARSVEETIGIAEGQQAQYEWQMAELRALQMRQWTEALQAEKEASAKRSEEFRTAKAYGYNSYEELQRAIREEKGIKRANELGLALAETEQITRTIAREGYAGAATEYGRDPGGMLAQQSSIVKAAQESISKNFSDIISVDAKGYQGYLQEASSYAGKVKELESRPIATATAAGTGISRIIAMQQRADAMINKAAGWTQGKAVGAVVGGTTTKEKPKTHTLLDVGLFKTEITLTESQEKTIISDIERTRPGWTVTGRAEPTVRKLRREDLWSYPIAKGTDISLEFLSDKFLQWKLASSEKIRRTVPGPLQPSAQALKDIGIGMGKLVAMGGMSSAYVIPSLEWAAREPKAYAAVIGPATALSFEQMAEEAKREPWEAVGMALLMAVGPKASPIKYQKASIPTGKTVTVPKWGTVVGPLTKVPEVVTYRGFSIESPHLTILKGGGFEPGWAGFETGAARHIGGITTKGPKPYLGFEIKPSSGTPKHLQWFVEREGFVPQGPDASITVPLMQRAIREAPHGEAAPIFSAQLKGMRELSKPTKPPALRDPYEVITEVERLPEGRAARQELLDVMKQVAPEAEFGGSFGMAIQSRRGKSAIPQDIDVSVSDPVMVSKVLKERYFDIHLSPKETRVSKGGGIERYGRETGEWYHAMDIHSFEKPPFLGEMEIGRYGLTADRPIIVRDLKVKTFRELSQRKISSTATMGKIRTGGRKVRRKGVTEEVPTYEYFTTPEKHRGKDIADSLMALESHTAALSESVIEPMHLPRMARIEAVKSGIGKLLKDGQLPVTKTPAKVYDPRAQAFERMGSVLPERPGGLETSRFMRIPGTRRYVESPFARQTQILSKSISDVVSGRKELPIGFSIRTRMTGELKGSPVKMNLDMPSTIRQGRITERGRTKEPSYAYSRPSPKKSRPVTYTLPGSSKVYRISQRGREGYVPPSDIPLSYTYPTPLYKPPGYKPSKYKPPGYKPPVYNINYRLPTYKPPGYKPPGYKPPSYTITTRILTPPPQRPPTRPPPWGGKDKKRTKKVRHNIFGALEMQHNIKLWDEVLYGTSRRPMKARSSPFLTVMTGKQQFTIPKFKLGATRKRLQREKSRIEAIRF